jgi:hypothetical protein
MKVVLNRKLFVVKVFKCKQRSILTSLPNTQLFLPLLISKNATEAKHGSNNWPISNV